MKDPALLIDAEFANVLKLAFTCIGCGTALEPTSEIGSAVRRRVVERGLCWVCRRSQLSVEKEMSECQ